MSIKNIEFPAKMEGLFRPRRYKVLYGGRGSGKSWSVARALLLMAARVKTRILCTREIQKSIKDSVHRLLVDQIDVMEIPGYSVFETEIRHANGSVFLFAGLHNVTAENLKSFEGVDIVWIEEAHTISEKSLRILIPTIRKERSEIWLTMNPELETDPAYVRFVNANDPGIWAVKVNWSDNPWFTPVLADERERDMRTLPREDYENIWEGKPMGVASGSIYRNEVLAALEKQIVDVPYDPALPVHTVWDLGWNDAMAIIFAQFTPTAIHILDYIEDSHRTLEFYVREIERRDYRMGTFWLPHDARAGNIQTGKTTEQILSDMTCNGVRIRTQVLPQLSVNDGIRATRMIFQKVFFDRQKTKRLVECLRRYRRDINSKTNAESAPLHDEYSHGADAFRYTAIAYSPPPPQHGRGKRAAVNWRTV